MTTRIAGGLISPKRAFLLAPLKGLPNNFSRTYIRFFDFTPLHVSQVIEILPLKYHRYENILCISEYLFFGFIAYLSIVFI
jgi:hypothetical protein